VKKKNHIASNHEKTHGGGGRKQLNDCMKRKVTRCNRGGKHDTKGMYATALGERVFHVYEALKWKSVGGTGVLANDIKQIGI